MVTKRQLLEYCDCLADDIAELAGTVHKLQVEVALLREQKSLDTVKRKVGRPKKNQ